MTIRWKAGCQCGHSPDHHDAVVFQVACIDPSRVLFEGVLGGCQFCDCGLYAHARDSVSPQA